MAGSRSTWPAPMSSTCLTIKGPDSVPAMATSSFADAVPGSFTSCVISAFPGSAEPTRNVVLGQLLLRPHEDVAGVAHLHEITGAVVPHVEERRLVADAGGLLHVVGHDDDRVVVAQLGHQVFDLQRCNRIES